MRIVQIGPYPLDASLIRGGVESSVYGLAQEQAKYNEVFVIDVPRIGGKDFVENNDSLTIYRFSNGGNHQSDAVKRLSDISASIERIRPDIVHIHGTSVFSWYLSQVLSSKRISIVLTVHGLVGVEKKKAMKQHFSVRALFQYLIQSRAEKSLLCSVDNVIVDTKYVSETIKSYHLRREPRVFVIPQGISERYYHISCSASSYGVLSVGAISPRKGHLFLIKAFERLSVKNKTAHLTICGTLADKSYYNSLLSYLSTSSCRDRVSIITNAPQSDLDDLYRRAKVFALHSQEESQGIVLVEAMAAGLPIIGTRVGGIPDVVDDRQSGILLDYGDIQGFADAMLFLLDSRDEWEQMSKNSIAVSLRYSWESIAERISDIYKHII